MVNYTPKSTYSRQTKRTAKSKSKKTDVIYEENEDIRELDKREIMKLKRYKDQIKRPDLPMDRALNFTDKELNISSDQSARQAKDNQKLFLQNYGIDVHIPTFFVIDSRIWPSNPDYIFSLIKYVLPERQSKTIQHEYNGRSTISSYKALYGSQLNGNLVLRLMHKGDNFLNVKKEIILRQLEWAKIVMSDDGQMIAIFSPETNSDGSIRHEIKIYFCDSEDPIDIMTLIEDQKHYCKYSEDRDRTIDLSFIKTMSFCNLNRKLIASGDKDFLILDIENRKGTIHTIDTDMFEQILSINYHSKMDNTRNECILACKSVAKLQIIVYDFFDQGEEELGQVQETPEKSGFNQKALINRLST